MVQEVLDDRWVRSGHCGTLCSRPDLGARFDTLAWAKKVFRGILSGLARSDLEGQCTFFTRGSLTFREAYLKTGRILNISVIPADRHSYVPVLPNRRE